MKSAIEAYEKLDSFLNELFVNEEFSIELDINVVCIGDLINFKIELNDQIIYNDKHDTGVYSINKKCKQQESNFLKIELYDLNKNKDHQSFIEFKKLYINNYDILKDYDFFRDSFIYRLSNSTVNPMQGFWDNAALELQFSAPFSVWYHTTSEKSRETAGYMKYRSSMSYDKELQILLDKIKQLKV